MTNPHAALQPVLHQLDHLLDASTFPSARARGANMTHAELIDYLDAELTGITDENTVRLVVAVPPAAGHRLTPRRSRCWLALEPSAHRRHACHSLSTPARAPICLAGRPLAVADVPPSRHPFGSGACDPAFRCSADRAACVRSGAVGVRPPSGTVTFSVHRCGGLDGVVGACARRRWARRSLATTACCTRRSRRTTATCSRRGVTGWRRRSPAPATPSAPPWPPRRRCWPRCGRTACRCRCGWVCIRARPTSGRTGSSARR